MAKVKVKKPESLDIAVTFGGVSIGEDTARVGLSIERKRLSLGKADSMLCGHRITGKILVTDGDEEKGQGKLAGMEDSGSLCGIEGSFDTKSISVSPKYIGLGLTFNLADIDVGTLAKFAKRSGKLLVDSVTPIEDTGKGAPEGEEEP